MTISPSFKRHWPQDRLTRLRRLEISARRLGIAVKARNGGSRTIFLPYITVWEGERLLASFWDIEEVERWFHRLIVDRLDAADKAMMAQRAGGAA